MNYDHELADEAAEIVTHYVDGFITTEEFKNKMRYLLDRHDKRSKS